MEEELVILQQKVPQRAIKLYSRMMTIGLEEMIFLKKLLKLIAELLIQVQMIFSAGSVGVMSKALKIHSLTAANVMDQLSFYIMNVLRCG